MRVQSLAPVGLSLALSGCLPVLKTSLPELQPGEPGFESTVQVRFLGVDGFMVRLGGDAFMTAPLYSNPTLLEVERNEEIPSCPERIEAFHHPTRRPEDIRAILVGHAHYDHLMDVVPVWRQLAPSVPIYGSLTLRNILAGYDSDGPVKSHAVVALNDPSGPVGDVVDYQSCAKTPPCPGCSAAVACPGHPQATGAWVAVPNSRIRILALCSAHPRQFAGIHKWPGCVKTERTDPPLVPTDYLEGEVFAYLIDFLEQPGSSKVVFRLYYQDAPSDSVDGWGLIPASWLDRDVDLALLCAGNWNAVRGAEEVVVRSRARNVVLGHWEDFFVPQSFPLQSIPLLQGEDYVKVLKKKARVTPLVPAPGVMMRFALPAA